MNNTLQNALQAWSALLGPERVLDGATAQDRYGFDTTGAQRQLAAALLPTTRDEVIRAVRIAHQHQVAVHPISTGNNWGYGSSLPVRDGCVLLDLSGMKAIRNFDAELGVVTVEPGVTQGDLARFLDEGGHPFLVPVTGAGPRCSLLGNALERGYGITPHTDHFGAVTDLKAVLADGSLYETALVRAGAPEAARLFKYGVGPYVNGLFTQSNLGVVTEISFLLARRPDSVQVCLFGLEHEELLAPAVERVRHILARLPGIVGGINLMNRHRMLSMAAPYPRDQLDARGLIPPEVVEALGRSYQIRPWTGLVTLYGTQAVVSAARAEIKAALRGVGSRVMFFSRGKAEGLAGLLGKLPGSKAAQLASTARTLARSLELVEGRPNETALPLAYWRNPAAQPADGRNPARDRCGLIWYAPLVPMRGTDVTRYVSTVREITQAHAMEPLITLTTVNDKVFDSTVPLLFDAGNPSASADAARCKRALLDAGHALGFVPYRYGINDMDWWLGLHEQLGQPIPPVSPSGTLAPGRYCQI